MISQLKYIFVLNFCSTLLLLCSCSALACSDLLYQVLLLLLFLLRAIRCQTRAAWPVISLSLAFPSSFTPQFYSPLQPSKSSGPIPQELEFSELIPQEALSSHFFAPSSSFTNCLIFLVRLLTTDYYWLYCEYWLLDHYWLLLTTTIVL